MEAERRRISEALPGYEVTGEIGRGAWGVVYAGEHRQLGRSVAIKQLPTAFGADPGLRARFTSEAQLIASLDHPHIVPVYDYLERDGLYLIVMEHLSGGTLWDRFSGEGLAQDQAVAILLAVCSALDHAHGHGVLHRDVKPENVMIGGSGTPKLTDFGIAKLLSSTRTALTVAGTAMGTPAYMAPEQARAGELGAWTDVYSCGVMLYEMLSGTLPFPESADPVVQLYQQVHEPARSLASVAPGIPAGICEVTMRALEKDPADRFASAGEFGVALAEAATAAWAPGWVGPTGVTVMDRGRITSVTERPVETPVRRASSPTIIVKGAGEGHPVLEPIEPLGEVDEPDDLTETDVTETSTDLDRQTRAVDTTELAEVIGLASSNQGPTDAPAETDTASSGDNPASSGDNPASSGDNPASGGDNPASSGDGTARVLPRMPVAGDEPPGRPRWQTYAAIAAAAVVLFAGSAAVAWAISRDDGGETDAASATTTSTTTSTTVATTTTVAPPDGRYVTLDDIGVQGDRYVVQYSPFRFEPSIPDPNSYHLHFFWDTYTPEQAGVDAPERGAVTGDWAIWDQPVFDAFAVADRPAGAERICAVVATHDHRVDDPANVDCVDLPS